MRLALPAGTYADRRGRRCLARRLSGTVGLQIGRAGPPQQTWVVAIAAGRRVDADVHARPRRELRRPACRRSLRVFRRPHPRHAGPRRRSTTGACIGRRWWRRPSLRERRSYFHDTNADVEATGFWARGRVRRRSPWWSIPPAGRAACACSFTAVRRTTTVRVATPGWSTQLSLTPGQVAVAAGACARGPAPAAGGDQARGRVRARRARRRRRPIGVCWAAGSSSCHEPWPAGPVPVGVRPRDRRHAAGAGARARRSSVVGAASAVDDARAAGHAPRVAARMASAHSQRGARSTCRRCRRSVASDDTSAAILARFDAGVADARRALL